MIALPKEGYYSITIPYDLHEKISSFVEKNNGAVPTKAQAIAQAWHTYEKVFLHHGRRSVRIGSKLVGPGHPCFIVAEIGINHNGSVEIAKKLIDMAVNVGCDAVKFQKRTVNLVYTPEELAMPRESPFGKTNGDLKKALEFGEEEYKEIDSYCKEKGIMWFASAWDEASVNFLEKFNVPCHKIASPCLTHKSLLEKVKSTGKPVILSTGMSTMEQVRKAVSVLGEENLVILHCTSTYPTPPNDHNLKVIHELMRHFNCPIGYSGHEPGVYASLVAAAMGACMVERHITLDRSMFGTDQAASLERKGLEIIGEVTRLIPVYYGDGIKKIHESEIPIMKKLRKVETL